MQRDILRASIEQVRKRASEGDRPKTPPFSVEWLEEMVLALAPPPDDPALLTTEEKAQQAKKCACKGSDDYCPCQNVRLK